MNPSQTTSLKGFTTPHAYIEDYVPNNRSTAIPRRESETLVMLGALKTTAKFTKKSAKFLFHPRYSLFIQGLKSIREDNGGYLKGFGTFIGSLMILASPAWLAVKVFVGVPALAVGTAATAVAGVATGVEWTGKAVFSPSESSKKQAEANKQREELMRKFVARMHEMLAERNYGTQRFFKKNPGELITIAAIAIAFTSRDVEGKCVRSAGQLVKEEDIANQDEERKSYFKSLCEMKAAIQSLSLSPDDDHAWEYLIKSFETLKEENEKDLSVSERDRLETIDLLLQEAHELSEKVIEDPIFENAWRESW